MMDEFFVMRFRNGTAALCRRRLDRYDLIWGFAEFLRDLTPYMNTQPDHTLCDFLVA